MTFLSRILSFFPAFVLVTIAVAFLYLCIAPGVLSILALLFSFYGFPLLVFRLHNVFYPLQEGISDLIGPTYSPWWGSHQIQSLYIAFPALESILRLIPGAFSLWLRLWGARIGRSVYWTPKLEIADRSLLEIGDRVIFGYQIALCSHIIKPRRQNLMLYVRRIKIGSEAFLGSGSYIGPGVEIEAGTSVPIASHLYLNTKVQEASVTDQTTYSNETDGGDGDDE
ncbi:acyl transferase [Leptolyngbya sp. 'hensonii']|uniref:acyl transferase n=1 Tax=Leptolyngbya sp. 'hensonii' TaxID=1922337 RepID=UPI00094FA18F|nr:acyl transferase [Leptolyngbya sp. 'hensonii']OLP19364.1 acyl transferase [Leptolyngbya sp. 'hensonii']